MGPGQGGGGSLQASTLNPTEDPCLVPSLHDVERVREHQDPVAARLQLDPKSDPVLAWFDFRKEEAQDTRRGFHAPPGPHEKLSGGKADHGPPDLARGLPTREVAAHEDPLVPFPTLQCKHAPIK